MACFTFKPYCLDVHLVPAHIQYPGMTVQACPIDRHYLCVRLMALVTKELHWCILGNINLGSLLDHCLVRQEELDIDSVICYQFFSYRFGAVTEETLFSSGSQVYCPVGMAVQTGKTLHANTMHLLALMASETESFLWRKLVHFIPMTFGTLYFFHKVMLCMHPGVVYFFGIRILFVFLPMTFNAILPGDYYLAVPWRDILGPVEDKSNKESVLLGNGKVMTLMTVDSGMFTLLPRIIGGFHKMATDTELRVVLGEIIKLEGYYTTTDNYYEEQYCNNYLALQGEAFFYPTEPLHRFHLIGRWFSVSGSPAVYYFFI